MNNKWFLQRMSVASIGCLNNNNNNKANASTRLKGLFLTVCTITFFFFVMGEWDVAYTSKQKCTETHYKVQLNCLPSLLFPLMHAYWFRKWVADWFGTEWPHVYWAHKSTGLLVLGLLTGGQATVIHHTQCFHCLQQNGFDHGQRKTQHLPWCWRGWSV